MQVSRLRQLIWCLACLLIGLPALLGFWLLRPVSWRASLASSA
jgi:hypothetical protein